MMLTMMSRHVAQVGGLLILGAVLGCGGTAPGPAAPAASTDPAASAPAASAPAAATPAAVASTRVPFTALPDGTAPRPFSAEQIRDAMPVGHRIRVRQEQDRAPTIEEEWVVTAADAQGCTIATKVFDVEGNLIRDGGTETGAWSKLREHAAFPAAATEISTGTIELPMGTFETRVYRVTMPAGDGAPAVLTLHFAVSLPGPPVLMVAERAGVQVSRMTMIERR